VRQENFFDIAAVSREKHSDNNDTLKTPAGKWARQSLSSDPENPDVDAETGDEQNCVVTNVRGDGTNKGTDIVVTVNGVIATGKLGFTPGQSLIVTTTSHLNNVIVTVNFKDGRSFVVSNKNID
jgi:hypothetical protein